VTTPPMPIGATMSSEPSPSGVMHDGWCEKLIPDAASLKLASAGRQHILDPLAFPSVGAPSRFGQTLPFFLLR
jgi:hypothetical protein